MGERIILGHRVNSANLNLKLEFSNEEVRISYSHAVTPAAYFQDRAILNCVNNRLPVKPFYANLDIYECYIRTSVQRHSCIAKGADMKNTIFQT